MKRHIFTQAEQAELLKNKHIVRVLNSNIEFTAAYRDYALRQHEAGRSAREIFRVAGVPDWLNKDSYALSTLRRWRKQKEHPATRQRGHRTGRKKSLDEMSVKELKARIAYLEVETEFLKKIHAL